MWANFVQDGSVDAKAMRDQCSNPTSVHVLFTIQSSYCDLLGLVFEKPKDKFLLLCRLIYSFSCAYVTSRMALYNINIIIIITIIISRFRCCWCSYLVAILCIFYTSITVRMVPEASCFQAVCPCVRDHRKVVNMISYELLVGISPNLQLWCSRRQRWTD